MISGYDKKELESIIAELYKRIPKRKKEDYKIDEFIKNIKIKKKSVKKTQTFDELYKEIIYFLGDYIILIICVCVFDLCFKSDK